MDTSHGNRIVVLVDMDCFYVQVEQKINPGYENKPCAVVQYNTWKGGGIIAVNYEARALGVKRGMRGNVAKECCPQIHLFQVPEVRGKADLTRYRDAGASVLEVLCKFSDCVERASIDEAYLDMTAVITEKINNADNVSAAQLPNTFVVGWDKDDDNIDNWLENIYQDDLLLNDQMLALAAVIVEEMRAAVYTKTGFRCSAGVAHNKMLSKLACGIRKPNKQTILPHSSVPILYSTLPLSKIRNLGGKLGEEVMEKLNAKTVGDLMKFSELQLHSHFGEKTGSWLYGIAKGIEHEPVISRQLPKSIGCGKNFPGKSALSTKDMVNFWLNQLSSELEERLQRDQLNNKRFARSLTVSVRSQGDHNLNMLSRTCPIHIYNSTKLATDALTMLHKLNTAPTSSSLWKPAILSLAMSASKFEDKLDPSSCNIQNYFSTTKNTSPSKAVENVQESIEDKYEAQCEKSKHSENCSFTGVTSENISMLKETTHHLVNKNSSTDQTTPGKGIINNYFTFADTKTSSTSNEQIKSEGDLISNLNSQNKAILIDTISESNSEQNTSENGHDIPLLSAGVETHCKIPDGDGDKCKIDNLEKMRIESEIKGKKISKGFFAKKLEEQEAIANYLQKSNKSVNAPHVHNIFKSTTSNIVGSFGQVLDQETCNIKRLSVDSARTKNNAIFPPIKTNLPMNTFFQPAANTFSANLENGNYQLSGAACSNTDELHQVKYELTPELSTLCKKCNQHFPIWEEQEHTDFHLAMEIQNEPQTKPIVKSHLITLQGKPAAKGKVGTKKRSGSKRVTASAEAKRVKQKVNTLDAFMK